MNRLLRGALVAGGGVAAAELVRRALRSGPRYQPWERVPYKDFPNRVLVVGGGFAGYKAAETLCKLTRDRDDVGVMVISRENYFTFWPMLAGIISSDVQTHNVAQPLRRALIRLGASFRRADLDDVDPEKRIATAGGRQFPYEHLILALGAEPAYFGIPGVEEHCISIRGIDAGERICNRVIERYEEATLEGDVPESKLTFVVIGGGATGVEVASELHSLVHDLLVPDYPNISPHRVKIILVDANKEILKELDPALRRVARKKLADLHVEVLNDVRAQEVTAEKVILNDGREIETQNVIWTAGARASVKLDDLPFPHDERKGLEVDRFMRVAGHENVWGIGDSAATVDERGEPVPPNAQAAVQEGESVARNVLAVIDGEEPKPFSYRPLGQLVEMGSEFAVNEVMGIKFSGLIAALFWRATYLYKLESPNSRARIAIDWLLDLFYDPPVTQIRR
ncbi:MAG TPA: NAD(P)/FAD-dependent oxidoreductase [Rubrobacteraceae bacterium]|nr:NAD(P)/FAD-dependent oxidoreductase [Rubrobacteraceae bacterium]